MLKIGVLFGFRAHPNTYMYLISKRSVFLQKLKIEKWSISTKILFISLSPEEVLKIKRFQISMFLQSLKLIKCVLSNTENIEPSNTYHTQFQGAVYHKLI